MKAISTATAFQMGVAFRLGYEYALHPELASLIKLRTIQARLITNDAEFKENEHPRDKDGRFKSEGSSNATNSIKRDLKQARAYFDSLSKIDDKYAQTLSPSRIADIDKQIALRYPPTEPTAKQIKSRNNYKALINNLIQNQTSDVQEKIKNSSINPNGLTIFPEISDSMAKKLGLKNKRVILTLYCQKRILAAHKELNTDNLAKGLSFSLYSNSKIIPLEANISGYKRFGVVLDKKAVNDVILDLRVNAGFYEVVHFHKNGKIKTE